MTQLNQLLGPNGKPISSRSFRKAKHPVHVGEGPGNWAGRDVEFFTLPGGSAIQFNLNNLTLSDYRSMRDHYQINASQAVLMFMVHQADWSIACSEAKIRTHCEENLLAIWTRLVRAISQAFWAGFAPSVLEWKNDSNSRTLQLTKIKDLVPEECTVNWRTEIVEIPGSKEETQSVVNTGIPSMGVTLPSTEAKVRVYNGIRQQGWPRPIPVENTFWYPLLMENGNYYGKKLLRPAFQSWFFSILMHLFSNRYFERFGEPVPIGRAPYDDDVDVDGTPVKGNVLMETVLTQIRNRSVVVLPNSRTNFGDATQSYPDYEIEYLESQMRGADFERYLTRLDEEMSLAMFTPLLILRTADVGSYNLGIGHMQIYFNMLNALFGDLKEYVDRYILSPMVNFNFSEKAPRATIKFRKLGKENSEILKVVLNELTRTGKVIPDLEELGQLTGMTLKEIKVAVEPPVKPGDPKPTGTGPRSDGKKVAPRGTGTPAATTKKISARIADQVAKAFRQNTFGTDAFIPRMGYRRQLEEELRVIHGGDSMRITNNLFGVMDAWTADMASLGKEEFNTADEFMSHFNRMLDSQLTSITATEDE